MAIVSAADYLIADGITDDHDALQALLDAYAGYEIRLPEDGSIAIDGEITLPSNTFVNGQGCTIIGLHDGESSDLFDIDGQTKIRLYDCVLDGNNTVERMLHYHNGASFVSIHSCTIQNFLRTSMRCPDSANDIAFVNNVVQDIGGADGVVTGCSSSYTKNAVIADNTFSNVGAHDSSGDWIVYTSGPPSEENVSEGDFALHCFGNSSDNQCSGGIKVQFSAHTVELPVRIYNNTIRVEAGGVHTLVLDGALDGEVYGNTHLPLGPAVMAFSVYDTASKIYLHDETINLTSQDYATDHYAVFAANSPDTEIVCERVTITISGSNYGAAAFGAVQCKSFEVKNCTVDLRSLSGAAFFRQYASHKNIAGIYLHDNVVTGCGQGVVIAGPCAGLTIQNNILNTVTYMLMVEAAIYGVTDIAISGNELHPGYQWGRLVGVVGGYMRNNTADTEAIAWNILGPNTDVIIENNG